MTIIGNLLATNKSLLQSYNNCIFITYVNILPPKAVAYIYKEKFYEI